jgi:hypothetical protein
MKFNIYGRFEIEVHREGDSWVAYRAALGKRRRVEELVIPCELTSAELAGYLDAFFHEYAQPGQRVELLPCPPSEGVQIFV